MFVENIWVKVILLCGVSWMIGHAVGRSERVDALQKERAQIYQAAKAAKENPRDDYRQEEEEDYYRYLEEDFSCGVRSRGCMPD